MLKPDRKLMAQLLACTCLIGLSSASRAVFDPGVGVGVQYTDNAGLTSDNEQDDIILLGYAGFSYDESTGPLRTNNVVSLVYEDYTDNTFSDQYYWDVDANLGWEQIRNRLDWVAQNRFSQREVDTLDADTPDNSQDTNIFSFGPNITLPVSARQTLGISPAYRKFYYEKSNTDNEEFLLSANWLYQLRPTLQTGLDGNVTKTQYDNERQNPDLVSSTLQAVIVGTSASTQYTVTAGGTHIQRDNVDDQEGFSGSFDLLRNLSGISDVRVYLATSLTDASDDAYNANNNPGRGNINNVQVNGDVFRDYIARTEYSRNSPSLQSRLWIEYRELDYKETPDDREIIEAGLDLGRPITQRATAGLYGYYNRTEQTDIDITEDRYVAGGNLSYQLSRKFRTFIDLQYQTKDSDDKLQEYDESMVFVGVIYGFGNVTRVGNNGGNNPTPR